MFVELYDMQNGRAIIDIEEIEEIKPSGMNTDIKFKGSAWRKFSESYDEVKKILKKQMFLFGRK